MSVKQVAFVNKHTKLCYNTLHAYCVLTQCVIALLCWGIFSSTL